MINNFSAYAGHPLGGIQATVGSIPSSSTTDRSRACESLRKPFFVVALHRCTTFSRDLHRLDQPQRASFAAPSFGNSADYPLTAAWHWGSVTLAETETSRAAGPIPR